MLWPAGLVRMLTQCTSQSLVMLSLFVGVVSSSMLLATEEQQQTMVVEAEARQPFACRVRASRPAMCCGMGLSACRSIVACPHDAGRTRPTDGRCSNAMLRSTAAAGRSTRSRRAIACATTRRALALALAALCLAARRPRLAPRRKSCP